VAADEAGAAGHEDLTAAVVFAHWDCTFQA
jgi:hypothetical protein